MKKSLAVLLILVLSLTLFSGCGKKADESSMNGNTIEATTENNTATETSSTETTDTTQGEPTHIIMTYLTIGTTPADLVMVQDAVNAISVPEINVEVEFKPISIPETFSQYSLWISTGTQVDLMMSAFQGIANFANTGSIEPLNDLIAANAPYISETMNTMPITDGAVIDGEIYGVAPVGINYGQQGALLFNKEILDGAGVVLKDRYVLSDFTDIFASVKAKYPDMYPYGITGDAMKTGSNYGFFAVVDSLGASAASGVLMGTDSAKIVNVFDTQEYYDYLKLVRSWYEAGYIMPDAATTATLKNELLLNKVVASYPMYNKPEQTADARTQYGSDFVALTTTDEYFAAISPSSSTYWTIPITSANTEAAMKFMDLMMANHEVSNLIKSGIEGVHYVTTDTEGIIAFPEGINPGNTTYFNPLGLYGDRRYELVMSLSSTREVHDAFTSASMTNPTKGAGYAYNSFNMTNQLIAIQGVLDQYLPTLETGSVDIDSVYPDFIKALKDAGIDQVIEDNQTQFDAWLKSK